MAIWNLNSVYDVKYEKIVTSGLTVWLDAGNSASYPGSGATWFDLSGNNNHITLVGSPTFSTNNGGILQFNGSTQYGYNALNYSTSSFTIMAGSRYSGATRGRVVSTQVGNWLLGHHGASCEEYYAEGWIRDTSINDTNWRIYTATENYAADQRSFYVNNNLLAYNSTAGAGGFNGLALGRYGTSNTEYSTCEISFILVYNRLLTRDEMALNFYAFRGRLGL